MQRLIAKNWGDFQHYKDRSPAWIKLHKKLLDDYEYQCLPLASKALAPMFWLLASESVDGCIEWDVRKVAFRLRVTESDVMDAVKPLIANGFFSLDGEVEQVASAVLAQCLPREEKRRERVEGEKEKNIAPPTGETAEVFEYWQRKMNHPRANLDAKRTKAIKARLKDGYSVGDLCKAIDGCKLTPYNMGQNKDGTVYDDIELICRDGPHVDRFLKAASAGLADMSPGLQNQVDILDEWVKERRNGQQSNG